MVEQARVDVDLRAVDVGLEAEPDFFEGPFIANDRIDQRLE